MLKYTVAAAGIAAGLSIAGVVGTQAQEQGYSTIGQWRIIANYDGGRFNRCIAESHSRSGMLRIAHFPNGQWNFSIPCYGESQRQTADVNLNRASDYLPMNVNPRGCRAWTDPLSGGWVAALRAGGNLDVRLGRGQGFWRLSDTGAALGAVQDCVRRNR